MKWGGALGIQQTLKAISDPSRREILDLLKSGGKTAGEIGQHFQATGATVSHHLSVLKNAGLIMDEKKGKFIYYELNMTVFQEILSWITAFTGGDQDE
ncbi:MAG: autorepressor SdpR family transcription factor [Anaerotignum sp.]|nr:autorepressor SdpR family transcription factor [Anaerotignum sp.]